MKKTVSIIGLIGLFTLLFYIIPSQKHPKYYDQQLLARENRAAFDDYSYDFPWLTTYKVENTLTNRIGLPNGYVRLKTTTGSFAHWLQHLPLKSGHPKVKLYNGQDKWNQEAQAYVVNMDVGKKDLQQCADALIRLRSEYLYQANKIDSIHFNYTNGALVSYNKWIHGLMPVPKSDGKVSWVKSSKAGKGYEKFKAFLIQVFNYAGTHSLEKELSSQPFKNMKHGDVLIRGGFPGHGIMVVDIAKHPVSGKKIFLLAQSFMPAQEIHILRNPNNSSLSPWYSAEDLPYEFETPEWTFDKGNLKTWN